MKLLSIQPPAHLKNVINEFWSATIPSTVSGVDEYKILADGAPGIIFQHHNGNSNLFRGQDTALPISFIYGQKNGAPCTNYIHGASFIFGVNFQPAAVKKLFLINTSELTNTLVELRNFFSVHFTEKLLDASSIQQLVDLFSQEISQKLLNSKNQSSIEESVNLIRNSAFKINSALLAQQSLLSRRQFQRKFKEYVGICPETYSRIVKFQNSIHLIKTGQFNKLNDIAYRIGYADHSHFGREFKLFSSLTPKEFLALQHSENDADTIHGNELSLLRIMKNRR